MESDWKGERNETCSEPDLGQRLHAGFTLIELMIVVAVIAIILTLALPTYQTYSTRAKVGEALGIGAAAKTAVAATCIEDPTIDPLTNQKAGYDYTSSEYVDTVEVSGPCLNPVITITTQNIGVSPTIVVTLTGDISATNSSVTWICASNAANRHLPEECRT